MPLHVLEVILARAERKDYIKHWRDRTKRITKYRITQNGLNYLNTLETDTEVERRINALLENIRKFFEEKGVILSIDKIHKLLLYFLNKNIDFLVECINPSISLSKLAPPKFKGLDRYLLEYIKYAENREPNNYKILEDLTFGSIVSVLLYVEEPKDLNKIRTTTFSHCEVFLDTNFIFSMLGLDRKEFNEPAVELLNLLKKYDFNLKVFSFTVDEICRVINAYCNEYSHYIPHVRVNTLHSELRSKGWSKTDAKEFIINIEQKLLQNGIEIKWIKGINLEEFKPNEELKNTIKKYKPDQGAFQRNHDLLAIAKIKEFREKTVRRIEDAKVLFLTSDFRLSRFNFMEDGHKQNGTICETVLDRLLTNILWLKNPNTQPPLKSIIAAHSHDLFVNKRVWDRFYKVLIELKSEGKIEDKDISTLFWHSYLEDALKSVEEDNLDKINEQFVLEEIEKAEKREKEKMEKRIKEIEKAKEKEMEMILKNREKEFSKSLGQSISDAELRMERGWLEKIKEIKESLREHSENRAGRLANIIIFFLLLAFVTGIAIGYYTLPYDLLDLSLTIVGGGGIIGLIAYRSKIKNKLFERIYRRKLEEAKLDEIT